MSCVSVGSSFRATDDSRPSLSLNLRIGKSSSDGSRQRLSNVSVSDRQLGPIDGKMSIVVPIVASNSYLVDPASSHMLVSKIKPCMSKYKPH